MRDGGLLINDLWRLRFEGINRLYGTGSIERLAASHVVVVGLGGVGSWTVEALARSGVGSFSLVDLDEVCISNTNRQVHALSHTVGSSKASVLADRLALINPDCAVCVREEWLNVDGAGALIDEEMAVARARLQIAARAQTGPVPDAHSDGDAAFLQGSIGAFEPWLAQMALPRSMPPPAPAVVLLPNLAVVDAIDNFADKAALLAACARRRVRCVSVGAAGGLTDPTMVRAADLTLAGDHLLKQTRGEMRRRHGFPAGSPRWNAEWGIRAVYSIEAGRAAHQAKPKGRGPTGGLPRADCDRFGTACFATGAMGFAAAAEVVSPLATAAAPPAALQGVSEGTLPELQIAGGADPGLAGGADPEIQDTVDGVYAGGGGGADSGVDGGTQLPSSPIAGGGGSDAPTATGVARSGVPRMCAAWDGRRRLDGVPATQTPMARAGWGACGALWPALEARLPAGRHAAGSGASPEAAASGASPGGTAPSPDAPRPAAGTWPFACSSHRLRSQQLGARRRSSVRLSGDGASPGAVLHIPPPLQPRLFDSHSHCHAVPTRTAIPFHSAAARPPEARLPSPCTTYDQPPNHSTPDSLSGNLHLLPVGCLTAPE